MTVQGFSRKTGAARMKRLQISQGLFVDQLATQDECSRALADLDVQVKRIQRQLEKPKPGSDKDWAHKAITALAFRKAARIAVRHRLADLVQGEKSAGEQRLFASVAREYMKRHPEECRVFVQQMSKGGK